MRLSNEVEYKLNLLYSKIIKHRNYNNRGIIILTTIIGGAWVYKNYYLTAIFYNEPTDVCSNVSSSQSYGNFHQGPEGSSGRIHSLPRSQCMSHSSLIAITTCDISYITEVGWGEVESIEQVRSCGLIDCMKKNSITKT